MKKIIAIATMLLTSFMLPGVCAAEQGKITVVAPSSQEKAYQIAGEKFVELWAQVTGQRPSLTHSIATGDLPSKDVVLIGSDAVNPLVHDLIRRGVLESLDLQYGSDGYRILCVSDSQHRYLILAGGNGRATIYAVYDFFHRKAGAEYFWDGDIIPPFPQLDFSDIDVIEKPHFRYRGLRYFAHRGLHRFQAEHWDLKDWQREIDWMIKKRFNFFMLRTGIDDLFQRTFPDEVPYPPTDRQDPDAQDRSYNDRTSFWPLKYRGELRKQVLQYARDRGLICPEDTGTITHWYSHTPTAFYRSFPDFPVIGNQTKGYELATAAIWDIENEKTWNTYWKLTETHIREFGSPQMFHTIGLAERHFGKTKRENFQKKLYVYRKTQQKIREHYPDAPLLIASWDLSYQWKDNEVQRLLKELDPERTILFEYTADDADKVNFRDWKLLGNFPWIFGIFHGFAYNSDLHGDYAMITERVKEAAGDRMCKGLVLWSEIAHNDTFMLEYLAKNSWDPSDQELTITTEHFCESRYPKELAARMKPLWASALVTSQSENWTMSGQSYTFAMPAFHMLERKMWKYFSPQSQAKVKAKLEQILSSLKPAPAMLDGLATLAETSAYDNPQWRRDALDMARTVANRALVATVVRAAGEAEAWRNHQADAKTIEQLGELNCQLLDALCDVLALSDDFSMAASLKQLEGAETLNDISPSLNPHTEQTLKGNAEVDYCRSHHYELARYVYRKETDVFWNHVLKRVKSNDRAVWKYPLEFLQQAKAIEDQFFETPLSEMAPRSTRNPQEMAKSLRHLGNLVEQLVLLTGKDNQ